MGSCRVLVVQFNPKAVGDRVWQFSYIDKSVVGPVDTDPVVLTSCVICFSFRFILLLRKTADKDCYKYLLMIFHVTFFIKENIEMYLREGFIIFHGFSPRAR